MKTINYQTNEQLWSIERAAKNAGYKKTDDCYWCQIFRNPEAKTEFCTSREEDSTNDPLADLAEMLTPSTTEEPAEAVQGKKMRQYQVIAFNRATGAMEYTSELLEWQKCNQTYFDAIKNYPNHEIVIVVNK